MNSTSVTPRIRINQNLNLSNDVQNTAARLKISKLTKDVSSSMSNQKSVMIVPNTERMFLVIIINRSKLTCRHFSTTWSYFRLKSLLMTHQSDLITRSVNTLQLNQKTKFQKAKIPCTYYFFSHSGDFEFTLRNNLIENTNQCQFDCGPVINGSEPF